MRHHQDPRPICNADSAYYGFCKACMKRLTEHQKQNLITKFLKDTISLNPISHGYLFDVWHREGFAPASFSPKLGGVSKEVPPFDRKYERNDKILLLSEWTAKFINLQLRFICLAFKNRPSNTGDKSSQSQNLQCTQYQSF